MKNFDNLSITARVVELMNKNHIEPYLISDIAGMPRPSFSRIVKNNRFPWRVEWLAKIALYFNVTLDYLIFGDKDFVKKKNREFTYNAKKAVRDVLLKDKKYLTYGKLQAEGFFKELED